METSATFIEEDIDITSEYYVLSNSEDNDEAIGVPIQHEIESGNVSPLVAESEDGNGGMDSPV